MGSPAIWAVHRSELTEALWTQSITPFSWSALSLRKMYSGVSSAAMIAVPTHGSILSFLEAL